MIKILSSRQLFRRVVEPSRRLSTARSIGQIIVDDFNIISSACKDVEIPKQQIDQVSMF
jgi:hypothetical protein